MSKRPSASTSLVQKKPRRGAIKPILITFIILVLLVGIAIGGIGFYFSSAIIQVNHDTPVYSLTATDVGPNTVTLPHTADTQAPGTFEIDWPNGQAIVGPITSSTDKTVTRQLIKTTAPLSSNTQVFWTRRVYSGTLKDSLGLTINDVQVPGPLGKMPAWFVPGKLTTWVLMVHGRGVGREENLRVFQPLSGLGLPLLAISYRNDIGSPASPDGWDHLGDTEWQDVEAGARYAIEHGAQHLVLYGWSKGGALVKAFQHRSSYAQYIQAMILDAPVLDWRATLAYQAQRRSLPTFVANIAETIVTRRSGINFDALDQFQLPQPSIPTLLFHK
jgi:uncharacterized protein